MPTRSRSSPRRPSLHPLKLIHEDQDILVIHKPAGLLTATTPRERRPTALKILRDYLAATDPRGRARLGLIHRLDRDAAGLLILSKNDRAYRSLKSQFFHHTVTREYQALVQGTPNPPAGRIESKLVEYADGTVHVSKHPTKGQLAITDYETIRTENNQSLLRVRLHTGRKHQIRAHLAAKGHPILGDPVYGKSDPKGMRLQAVKLTIQHPRTGQQITFTAA